MMLPGLPASLDRTLRTNHSVRVKVRVLDTAMRPVGAEITSTILDGSVNVDLNAEVTRSGTITFFDPAQQLDFDSDSPADGALYADRMLAITYGVREPGGSWVDVPVLTGPVVKFSRNGSTVQVEVQGKERLAMGASWRTKTYKKSTRKVDVISNVMREEGERNIALLASASKLPGDRALTREESSWSFARGIAGSMGLHLFYDGAGVLRLRQYPRTSLYTFDTGTGGVITGQPSVDFLVDNVRNAVHVTGKKPKGAKRHITATAVAPSTHPLSPARLGRNGQGRYLAEFISDDKIGSEAEAKRVARNRLDSLLVSLVEVKFESAVIPHLDAGDYVTVKTDGFTMMTRLTSFSIPLTASGRMTVGYNRRMKRPNRKAIR